MNTLKQLRLNKNVLQKDVAKYLDVDRTTYVKYERGDSEPNHDILVKLADYFDVTVDYLLGREEKPSENSNDLSNKIMELFNRLDEKHQQQVIEYTRFVLSLGDDEQN